MDHSVTPGARGSRRAKPIQGVPTSITGFVGAASSGPTGRAVRVSSFPDYLRRFGDLDPASDLGYAVLQFFANGGSDARIVAVPPGGSVTDALAALDDVRGLALLCLPGEADPEALRAALAYAERRRAFLIVDPPGPDPDAAVALARDLGNTGIANGALYFPSVLIASSLDPDGTRTSPPSGSVAGVYARTDATNGVWKAPAGNDAVLLGVEDVAVHLDTRGLEELVAAGVNPLRLVDARGSVVWGARTIAGADGSGSEWRYVPVRRLGMYLERSIERGTRWAVFEPNDEPLWASIRLAVGDFLHGLWKHGAFVGTTPEQAYFVRCDRSTMTQNDIDNGRLIVEVGVAPVKPAEFVIFRIGRWTGASVTEQLGPASGEPGAAVRLARRPVSRAGFVLQVEGRFGWTNWSVVDELDAAAADAAVYVLDAEQGLITFGDGVHGAIPATGAGIAASYRHGSGRR